MARKKTKPRKAAKPKPNYEQELTLLREAYVKNHDLLEKVMLGIPAAALAFLGAVFKPDMMMSGEVKVMLGLAFASFALAMMIMLASYLGINGDIRPFLEGTKNLGKHGEKLDKDFRFWDVTNTVCYTLIVGGIALTFLATVENYMQPPASATSAISAQAEGGQH